MADETGPILRGTFEFEVTADGDLINSPMNVESLRRMWLHPTLVEDESLGPGNRGDFDIGAWHVACHLAGAGGVMRSADGKLMWLEISHDPVRDDYYASTTTKVDGVARTFRIDSAEGRYALRGARLLGFVEGNSLGRVSARLVNDPPTLFNLWRRQDFDQPVDSLEDGGKVWEHWCTLRDIRQSSRIGTAVLTAYVSLVAALGDLFVPTVARGRRTYGHPKQLAAMVHAGFVGHGSAVAKIDPVAIPAEAEPLLLEALPASSLEAAEIMRWKASPQYYMFHRKIRSWSTVAQVRADLKSF